MSLLIIDNYDSFTYNLYQMVQCQTDAPVVVARNDAMTIQQIKEAPYSGIILSPGPGHPENARDFGVCADVIRTMPALGIAVLGVCLGHQGIASCLGGRVERAPEILHGKTSVIEVHKDSPLFVGLPKTFVAMRYHSLVVSDVGLPDSLDVVARDSASGLIMAMQSKHEPLYGVQFHPESIGTAQGATILRNFVELCCKN